MYLWICENTYADVLVTRFPDIKILKHTHNLVLVINILFSVTTKQYLWWNSYHKFLSRIASLSSIKCSQYHLGDLYKFCKSHLFFCSFHFSLTKISDFKDISRKHSRPKVSFCVLLHFFSSPHTKQSLHVKCHVSNFKNNRHRVCVLGEKMWKRSTRKKERKETLLKLNKD